MPCRWPGQETSGINSESEVHRFHPMAFVDMSCYLLSSFPLMGICALHCLRCFGFGSATLLVSPVPFMGVCLQCLGCLSAAGLHLIYAVDCLGTRLESLFQEMPHRAKNPPITILQPSRERSCFSLFTTCRTYRRVLPVLPVLCRQDATDKDGPEPRRGCALLWAMLAFQMLVCAKPLECSDLPKKYKKMLRTAGSSRFLRVLFPTPQLPAKRSLPRRPPPSKPPPEPRSDAAPRRCTRGPRRVRGLAAQGRRREGASPPFPAFPRVASAGFGGGGGVSFKSQSVKGQQGVERCRKQDVPSIACKES